MRLFALFFTAFVLAGRLALAGPPGPAPMPVSEPVAELEPRDIYLGQSLMLRVYIPGEATAVITVPRLADWTVVPRGRVHGLRGPGTGDPVTAYRFELIPRRDGRLTVPALTVESGGRTSRTAPLEALVRPRPTPPKALAGHDVFLDATLSKPDPYAGEFFVYTLRLYRAVTASGISLAAPRFPDMDVTPLPGQRDGEIEFAGRRYAVTEAEYLLTAASPGQAAIPPATVVCRGVPGKGGAAVDLTVKGPAVPVTVRALPDYAGDAPFTGLVGRMTLASRLDAGAPGREAVYTLTLAGRGNLADAPPPPVVPPAGGTVRFLEATGGGDAGRSGYVGQRTFRYAVSAAKPGDYVFGPTRLAVFDPASGRYAVIEAPAQTYRVLAAASVPADPSLAPPLRHVAGDKGGRGALSWPWRLVLALLPPLAYALTFLPRRPRRARATFAGSPFALAEALRDRLDRAAGKGGECPPAAVIALRRLDAVLYDGRPVSDRELGQAVDAAAKALAELEA
ncbi:MAG: BatD family protein [Desulfovibrio sp.]